MNGKRITPVHQSLTFSRRMVLLGGVQAVVGTVLVGRLGYLAVAQNQKYQLLSESNRVQLIPVPPRRGWIIDRNGKPIAINRSSFRVDIIPASSRIRAASSRSRSRRASPMSNMRRFRSTSPSFRASPHRAALPVFIPPARRSASWSAMSEPPRPRNMRKKTRTRC
jgi:cell division protein FtsI/penicillin-binding protein 2